MPPVFCNKCKTGLAAEGDSWCIGCSALEFNQNTLKTRWQNPGIRRVAEDTILSCARQVKALANLDKSIVVEAGSRKVRTFGDHCSQISGGEEG